jgi:hypothetical protein
MVRGLGRANTRAYSTTGVLVSPGPPSLKIGRFEVIQTWFNSAEWHGSRSLSA